MAVVSIYGLFISKGILDSSYIIVYVKKCAITCVSKNRPLWSEVLVPILGRYD